MKTHCAATFETRPMLPGQQSERRRLPASSSSGLTPLARPPALRVREHLLEPLGLNFNRQGLGTKGLRWARTPLQNSSSALCKGMQQDKLVLTHTEVTVGRAASGRHVTATACISGASLCITEQRFPR